MEWRCLHWVALLVRGRAISARNLARRYGLFQARTRLMFGYDPERTSFLYVPRSWR